MARHTMGMMVALWALAAVVLTASGALAQACSESDKTAVASSAASFANRFFECYDAGNLTLGACFTNSSQITPACSACFQAASICVASNCAESCVTSPKTPECLSCAKENCQAALDECTGSDAFSLEPCTTFFCQQPPWVLGVIIGASVLGFVILFGLLFLLVRYGRCGCSCPEISCCCGRSLKDQQRIEERLRQQNQERIERLNQGRDASSATDAARYGRKTDITKASLGIDYPQNEDDFEMGFNHGDEWEDRSKAKDDWGGSRVVVDKREHNVRASKLPEGFRIQSVQPGLTPEMIFNMDTYKTMSEANKAASAVPAAVIASHKALKMMGVNEAEVQKPYSEPVTQRVERLAKAANAQGLMAGGATANLGGEIVEQYAAKRKAAEERAAAFRQAQLKKEEERIRKEIKAEAQEEKRRTLRQSQKLTEDETKRLSLAAAARRSAKAAQQTVQDAGNRLKDFLEKTENKS